MIGESGENKRETWDVIIRSPKGKAKCTVAHSSQPSTESVSGPTDSTARPLNE